MSLISLVPQFRCDPRPTERHSPPPALRQLPGIAPGSRGACHAGSPEAHGAEERDLAGPAFPRLHTMRLFLKPVRGTKPQSLRRALHLSCLRWGLEGERQKKREKAIKKN